MLTTPKEKALPSERLAGQRKVKKRVAISQGLFKQFIRETKAFLHIKCFTACRFGQVIVLVIFLGAIVCWRWLS